MAKNVHFIHVADLHLSAPFANLPDDVRVRKINSQRASIDFLVQHAIKNSIQLFLVSGDVFDIEEVSYSTTQFVKNAFQKLMDAGIKVFVIPGNHDPLGKGCLWDKYDPWPVTHLFRSKELESYDVEELGVTLIGAGFYKERSGKRLLGGELPGKQNRKILLFHGAYESFGREMTKDCPFSATDLEATQANYIALGHYHSFTEILSEEQRVAIYPGSIEGLGFSDRELDNRFAVEGVLYDTGAVTVEKIQLPSLINSKTEIDVSGMNLDSFYTEVRRYRGENVLLKVKITGVPSLDFFEALSHLENDFSEDFMYIEIQNNLLDIPDDSTLSDKTYKGQFFMKLKKLIDSAEGDQKDVYKKALSFGLRAFHDDKRKGKE